MVLKPFQARLRAEPKREWHWVFILMHVAALAPLALLLWDWSAGRLSFNPIREITLRTGRYALIALILSLACTPVYLATRFRPLRRMRRALGLYAFMYAGLHLLTEDWDMYGIQMGRALEQEGLPLAALQRAQLRAYLRFYLRPSKIANMFRLVNLRVAPIYFKNQIFIRLRGIFSPASRHDRA